MVDDENKDFAGKNGFTWWIGVVEDRQDPLKLGRCRVRCVGWHAEDKLLLPTEFLPWAMPSMPLNNANAYTAKEGDMVFGFFVDGENAQEPVMMGVIPGIPLKAPNRQEAFTDNRSNELLKESPRIPARKTYKGDGSGIILEESESAGLYPIRLDEPSTPRLARNDAETILRTFVTERKLTRVRLVPSFNNLVYNTWDEPETSYNAKYPYNNAVETESGHIMEFDDTFGSERIHIAHRNGSFIEWMPDGTRVEKVTKNNYSIILSDDHLFVMGNVHVTVQGNTEIYVRENAYLRVDKDLRANVGGNMLFGVDGDFKHYVRGTYTAESLGNMSFKAPRIDLNKEPISGSDSAGSSAPVTSSEETVIDQDSLSLEEGTSRDTSGIVFNRPPGSPPGGIWEYFQKTKGPQAGSWNAIKVSGGGPARRGEFIENISTLKRLVGAIRFKDPGATIRAKARPNFNLPGS